MTRFFFLIVDYNTAVALFFFVKWEGALCFFQMLRQRTCHGIFSFTHIDKRSSFLADDEVDELSSLSLVSLKLKELCLL